MLADAAFRYNFDAWSGQIALKGPQRTVELRIPNPEQFKKIAKGDQVEATFTQAVAIAVQPAASKERRNRGGLA